MSEVEPGPARSTTAAPRHGTARAWIPVLVGALFVVAAAGLTSYLLRDRTVHSANTPAGFTVAFTDSFNRPAGPIASARGAGRWVDLRGGWSIAAGAAYVSRSVMGDNIAVVEAGPYASVSAKVSGVGRCGLIADLVDAGDFLSLVRAEKFGVWNLQRQGNGDSKVLATVPGSKATAQQVSIAVEPPIVTATVGDAHVSVSIADLSIGRSAGLLASGTEPTACAFDDVIVSVPG